MLGHPKSGTNWLCSVLSDYYDIPVFKAWLRVLPAVSPQIFHMHRFVPTAVARRRTFYLYRDGRDILVSRFFAIVRSKYDDRAKQAFERYTGVPMAEQQIREQLPAFIDWSFQGNQGSSVRWHAHVERAFRHPYVRLSYEAMKADTFAAVARAIEEVSGVAADPGRLKAAIAANAFEKKKAADNAHFLRSGTTGDWRKHFSRAAAERFEGYANRALVMLGYEAGSDWIKTCTP